MSTGHPTEVSQIHVAKHSAKFRPVQLVSIFKVVEMTLCLREHACPVRRVRARSARILHHISRTSL